MDEIAKKVTDIVAEILDVEAEKVVPAARFREELEADSLDLVELIMAFEDEFSKEISDEEAQQILTVGQAIEYVQRQSA